MRKIFGLLALLITGGFSATSALYLHHERSSQATVEADCQNREVCLDKVNLAPIGRFNDGTLWHGVTQEKPNVNLTGTLTVTGATVLSNNLTLSLFATGRIPYTTTAGLLTSGTGLTYNGSAFSVTGTGAISGNTTVGGSLGVTGVSAFGGATTNSGRVINIGNGAVSTQGGGTSQYGLVVNPLAGTDATSSYYAQFLVAQANGSVTELRSLQIDPNTKTGGTVTNNIALSISNQTVGTNNWAIKTGTGLVDFGQNVLVAGTLGVTGVTTATGGLSVGTATVSTAAEFDGSKNLVSVTKTGTGNDVYSASPTLTGTITAAAITASGLITANGGIQSVASVASSFYETGTFTMSLNGFSACTNGILNAGKCEATASYVRVGKAVSILIPQMYGTSNTTTMEVAGIPASIQAASFQLISIPDVSNNGTTYIGAITAGINGANTVYYQSAIGSRTTVYTNSGSKGIQNQTSISYTTL